MAMRESSGEKGALTKSALLQCPRLGILTRESCTAKQRSVGLRKVLETKIVGKTGFPQACDNSPHPSGQMTGEMPKPNSFAGSSRRWDTAAKGFHSFSSKQNPCGWKQVPEKGGQMGWKGLEVRCPSYRCRGGESFELA